MQYIVKIKLHHMYHHAPNLWLCLSEEMKTQIWNVSAARISCSSNLCLFVKMIQLNNKKNNNWLNMSKYRFRPLSNLSYNLTNLSEAMANYFPLRLPAAASQ